LTSEKNNNDIWFPAKKYGYGWGLPATWQGWVVLLAYVALVVTASLAFENAVIGKMIFIPTVVVLSAIFIFICWKKGQKPHFRWGGKK